MYKRDMLIIYLDQSGRCIYHLGAGYIIAYLRSMGYKADFLIEDDFFNISQLANQILEMDPQFIGFSTYDTNYHMVKEVSSMIKELSPTKQRIIISGGPTATFSSTKVLNFGSAIDICVRNEGEETTLELIKAVRNNNGFESIMGITYRNAEGKIIENPSRELPQSLDIFPSPYLSGVIDVVDMFQKNRMVTVVSSRGCVFNCQYCNFAAVGRHCICYHSVDRVIDELKYISEVSNKASQNVRVQFMDDIFTINHNRTIEICKMILEENINCIFGFHTRTDCIDEELIDYLYRAGCRRISYGLESGVPRILNEMGKVNPHLDKSYSKEKEYIEKTGYIVEITRNKKIETIINIILGWESETKDEALQTLQLVKEMNPDRYFPSILTYYAGTEAFSKAIFKVQDKIDDIEKTGVPVFNFSYNQFPELYQYNPYEIAHMDNNHPRIYKLRSRQIIQSIMGIGYQSSESLQVLMSYKQDIKYDWLVKNINMTTKVAFAEEANGISTFSFPETSYGYECVIGGYFPNAKKVDALMESRIVNTNEVYSNDGYKFPVLQINNISDAWEFYNKTCKITPAQLIDLFSIKGKGCFIEDYCCWCDECPAVNLKRIIIKDDNMVYTCFKGKPLCHIENGLDTEKIKTIVDDIRNKEYIKRGCNNCSIRNSCSKCLFVDHIGIENYCKLKKEMHTNKNFKTISKIKLIDYFFKN